MVIQFLEDFCTLLTSPSAKAKNLSAFSLNRGGYFHPRYFSLPTLSFLSSSLFIFSRTRGPALPSRSNSCDRRISGSRSEGCRCRSLASSCV